MADDITEQELDKFIGLMNKIDTNNPNENDVEKAEEMIWKNPRLYRISRGLAGGNLKQLLDKLSSKRKQQLLLEAEALSIKKDLGYSSSNTLEKLIIDQILYCWAGINYVELRVLATLTQSGLSFHTLEYWQENLTRYQNRYLRAIETLARVRKLNKSISLQVNVATDGGKQINVNELNK